MAFAENLRLLRKRKGLTQKELADLSGVSCNSIINYENSRRTSPPISVLQKLARALETSVDILASGRIVPLKNGGMEVYFGEPEDTQVDDYEEFISERGERDIVEQLAELIRLLNKDGAAEALKRVRELTEIQRYSYVSLPPLKPDVLPMLHETYRRHMEVTPCPEDAPQTAAEPNPDSDQTDAGKVGIRQVLTQAPASP